MDLTSRLRRLPGYLFAEIDKKVAEKKNRGVDVIKLGVGDPDLPTPTHIIDRMKHEVEKPENHQYPSYLGLEEFREAVVSYYKDRFNLTLDYENEVVSLIGSKEGIAHISQCFVEPGDINLVPDPGYPVYGIGTLFAGGESYPLPLKAENDFLIDLAAVPEHIAREAKILFFNYPNNPTSAVADTDFFQEVVEFCRKYDIVACHDAAYTEIAFDGYQPPSFLQAEGAKEVGIEFGSLSKTFNMTGWRIGYAVGNPDILAALGKFKTNIDSGAFQAVQLAAVEALTGSRQCIEDLNSTYERRRDIVINGLQETGIEVKIPKGTFYVWAPVPNGFSSSEFAAKVLDDTGVVVTPGNGFGEQGEGYFRIALTVDESRMEEAMERLTSKLKL